jgi:hypothetical protein
VSDPAPTRVRTVPSRARRRRIAAGAGASLALALAGLGAWLRTPDAPLAACAGACAAAALWAGAAAWRAGRSGAEPEFSDAAPARALYVGPERIVLLVEGRRRVVWRDATDQATFRRLAARARWRAAAA